MRKVIDHQPDGYLSLPVRVLINGRGDGPFFEIRRHRGKQVGGDKFYFTGQAFFSQRATDRKAVYGVHINAGQRWNALKQVKCLLKTFVFVLVTLNDRHNLSARAMAWKAL